jgi:hypothetical protein
MTRIRGCCFVKSENETLLSQVLFYAPQIGRNPQGPQKKKRAEKYFAGGETYTSTFFGQRLRALKK